MEQDLLGATPETADAGAEAKSNEPDTGPDVQQDGEFQGEY